MDGWMVFYSLHKMYLGMSNGQKKTSFWGCLWVELLYSAGSATYGTDAAYDSTEY